MGDMWNAQGRQMLKVVFTIQAIQAAAIGSGSDTVRKVTVNAAGLAEEASHLTWGWGPDSTTALKPTQDGKIGKDMVRKVAVNAAGLPEEGKPGQDGKIGETVMARQIASITATMPEEHLKHTQNVRSSGTPLVRKVAPNAADLWSDGVASKPSRHGAANETDLSEEASKLTQDNVGGSELKSENERLRAELAQLKELEENARRRAELAELREEQVESNDYERAKAALKNIADLVRRGDMTLLQTGNRTSRKAKLCNQDNGQDCSKSFDPITGKKLAGLVATVLAGGATPEVIEVISTIVNNLQTGALAKIIEDHNDAQTKINADLDDLKTTTEDAVDKWHDAAGHDTAWLACVTEEHALLQEEETCRSAEASLLQDKVTKCNLSASLLLSSSDAMKQAPVTHKLSAAFEDSSPRPDLSFSCNFESDNCESRVSTIRQNIDRWFEALSNKIVEEKQKYFAAAQACKAATTDYQNKVNECTEKHSAFFNKEILCERKKGARSVRICAFGDKLQAKCKAKQVYDTTIGGVDGNNTVFSDSERRNEWNSVSTIKCMLNQFKAKGSFTKEEMISCESSSNYDTDVGRLNKKDEVYQRLIAPDNFTCSETHITFNGSLWTVPDGEDTNSSQYTYGSHNFSVNTSEGSQAFAFCSEGDDGPNCSTFSGCPGGYTRRDDVTICQLATGCTIADCCVSPAPTATPTEAPTPTPTTTPTEAPTPTPTTTPTANDVQTCQEVNVVASTQEALPFANIASQSVGGIPFGSRSLGGYCSDSSGGQGLRSESGIHCWKNINDGKLGNAHSWIPGIANAFVGVRFHSMSEIQGFRLSRKGEGSCCNDRIGGNYEIQYTSSADAGFSTPDSAWCSTGTFTRSSYGFVYFKFSSPVSATAVRIKVSDAGACIDELEVYGVSEAMVPMVDCVVPSGWSRPYGNVELSKSGAERCKRKCADGGYTYFGLECPMGTQVHCQCSNAVGGTSKSFAYCEGAGDPLVHAHDHCSGPYIVGGYRFGDYTVGSVYSTQARAL